MNSVVADGIGYLAAAFTATMSVLQALRIRRHGIEGVSPLTWTTVLATMSFWLAYGIGTGLVPVIAGNIVCAVATLCTLWSIGVRRSVRSLALSAATTGVLCVLPAAIWGWDAGLPGAAALSVALCVPQIVDLYRTDTAAGVSANAWLIGGISILIWIAYGIAIERWVMVGVDCVVLAANIFIALLAFQRHRTLRRLEVLAEA